MPDKNGAPDSADSPKTIASDDRGVGRLLKGSPSRSNEATPEAIEGTNRVSGRGPAFPPRWYFFGLDLALLAVAGLVAFFSPQALSVERLVFCGFAVGLGAICALIPLIRTGR